MGAGRKRVEELQFVWREAIRKSAPEITFPMPSHEYILDGELRFGRTTSDQY